MSDGVLAQGFLGASGDNSITAVPHSEDGGGHSCSGRLVSFSVRRTVVSLYVLRISTPRVSEALPILAGYSNHASSRPVIPCIFGLPRILHLLAVPAADLRVSSILAPFGDAGGEVPGCP